MPKSRKKAQLCSFCRRPFDGDNRNTYCSKACVERIYRANPERHTFSGYFAPGDASPHTDVIHAVSPANLGGGRTAACSLYGRFIPANAQREWQDFERGSKHVCWRCIAALEAFAPRKLKAVAS